MNTIAKAIAKSQANDVAYQTFSNVQTSSSQEQEDLSP